MFKYLKTKWLVVKDDKRFITSMDVLITGLILGLGIFLIRIDNSFAQGIGLAVIIALVQEYVSWLAQLVRERKK